MSKHPVVLYIKTSFNGKVVSKMGLSREFITEATDCPRCGTVAGVPCRSNGRNHFERMHKAQVENPEEAGDYKPKKSFEADTSRQIIEKVNCEPCGAGAGSPCVSGSSPIKGYHLPRVKAVMWSLSDRSLTFYSYGKLSKGY